MHEFGRVLGRSFNENYLNSPYFHWPKAIGDTIVEEFIRVGESLSTMDAKVGNGTDGGQVHTGIRTSTLSWIKYTDETKLLYDLLISRIDSVNFWHYGFALDAMDGIQYTRYPVGGHYTFHHDILKKKEDRMRKLSVVVGLSAASDYEGGELEIAPSGGNNPHKFKLERGDLIAFPSWTPHRVAPVTSGHRITAVAWVLGPKFV
jgi:predicted 2-oxoglutarate/Fe(II)-dependent dioxygenase YbiX